MSKLPWHADVRVSATEAIGLARSGFGLSVEHIEPLGEGWDYINFLADGTWVLRFPKRAHCGEVLVAEEALLRHLAQMPLPLPVPRFEFFSKPTDDFPWCFAGYRLLPGTPLERVEDARHFPNLAASVGEFLGALHAVPMAETIDDPWQGGDDDNWKRREFAASRDAYPSGLAARVAQFVEHPWPPAPDLPRVLVHADLNAEHILVDESRRAVTGIIDWADAHCGIRTQDFVGLYYLGGEAWVAEAFDAAGVTADDAEWQWLAHHAAAMGIGQVFYGTKAGMPNRTREALERLQQLV